MIWVVSFVFSHNKQCFTIIQVCFIWSVILFTFKTLCISSIDYSISQQIFHSNTTVTIERNSSLKHKTQSLLTCKFLWEDFPVFPSHMKSSIIIFPYNVITYCPTSPFKSLNSVTYSLLQFQYKHLYVYVLFSVLNSVTYSLLQFQYKHLYIYVLFSVLKPN